MTKDTIELIIAALPTLGMAALTTLQISLFAIIIGMIIGSVIGVINSKQLPYPILKRLISAYVTIIRGTPLFVQLFIVYFGLPQITNINLSPLAAGIITLGFNSSAYLAEIIRAGVNAVPTGQWQSCYVLGYTKIQTLRYVVLPQAFSKVWPIITNELVSLIKESSILMILGVQELTKVSKDIVAKELKPMEIYLITAIIYLILTFTIAKIAKYYERRNEHAAS